MKQITAWKIWDLSISCLDPFFLLFGLIFIIKINQNFFYGRGKMLHNFWRLSWCKIKMWIVLDMNKLDWKSYHQIINPKESQFPLCVPMTSNSKFSWLWLANECWYVILLQISRKRASTCPLCKASFLSITKVEDAACTDQKIYSQTVPHALSSTDVYLVADLDTVSPGAQVTLSSHYSCFSKFVHHCGFSFSIFLIFS